MKKKKIIKIILIIILVLIILFLINTFRKFFIIRNLQEKISQYTSIENYHIKTIAQEDSNTILTTNYYQKDGKQVMIMERNKNGEISKISMYDNGSRIDVFYDNPEGKKVQLNADSIININIYNYLETNSNWKTLILSALNSIRNVEYNGKNCYVFKDIMSFSTVNSSINNEIYIEKDTGLFVKAVSNNSITEKQYEFNNVSDSIFEEPDIGQYEIIESD